jgi:hypothetical protein
MRNTADVIGGKAIAVLLLSVSGVSAINPLVAFYDIHGGKREVLLFCPGHHTRQQQQLLITVISSFVWWPRQKKWHFSLSFMDVVRGD